MNENSSTFNRLIFGGIVAILLLIMGIRSCTVVGPTERGVMVTWGKVGAEVLEPGIHLKAPIGQKIRTFRLEPKTYEIKLPVGNDGAITKDMQTVGANISVRWMYDESRIKDIVTTYRDDKIIESAMADNVKTSLKETTGKYSIYDLVQEQNAITDEVSKAMLDRMKNYPIAISQTTITNWDWSDDFDRQIKETANRTQQVKQAEQEANIAAAQAQKLVKEAEAKKAAAELDAQAQITKAKGEAEAVKIRADASAYEAQKVAQNQQAYQKQWDYEIALERAKHWNGKEVPDAAYVVPGTGAVVPLTGK